MVPQVALGGGVPVVVEGPDPATARSPHAAVRIAKATRLMVRRAIAGSVRCVHAAPHPRSHLLERDPMPLETVRENLWE